MNTSISQSFNQFHTILIKTTPIGNSGRNHLIITCDTWNPLKCRGIESHHDDVIKWKHFPRYWPFVWGIHRSPVNFPHKGQWGGALMFSLICALDKRLSKQSRDLWFETPLRPLWLHCKVVSDSQWRCPRDEVIKWKHFPRYCPFVRGIHRSPDTRLVI